MRLSRRQLLAMISAFAAVPDVLAQSSGEDATQDAASIIAGHARRIVGDNPPTLSVLVPAGCEPNLAPVIKQFLAMTGVRIRLQPVPVDDINARLLLNEFTGRERYDGAVIATFGMPDLVDANALRPVDQYEARYPLTRELRQQSLYQLGDGFAGKIYGPQTDGDLYLMFYNRALLEDPAISEQYAARYGDAFEPAKTWAELDRMMAFVHDPANDRYGGVLFRTPRYIAWEYWMRLHAKGLLPFDDDMRPQIQTLGGIAALEELLAASASQHPDVDHLGLVGNWQQFSNGNALCHLGWGGSQKYFSTHSEKLPKGVRATPLPGGFESGRHIPMSYFNWGWNIVVPKSSAHPELAFLFAMFTVGPQISDLAVRERDGFFDPFRPSHYEDAAIIDTYGEAFLTVHRNGMQQAIPDLYIRGQRDYEVALSTHLLIADRGQVSPIEALEAVAERWDSVTDALDRSAQRRQWLALKRRYPPDILAFVKA